MMTKTLKGRVTAQRGQYYVVSTIDSPRYLSELLLTPREMKGANVGDHVTLGYYSTNTCGFWSVVSVDVDGANTSGQTSFALETNVFKTARVVSLPGVAESFCDAARANRVVKSDIP